MRKSGLDVFSEVGIPVVYDGIELEVGYRIDLLVQDYIIIELKSVDSLIPVHKAQLLTYLKLARKEVGLLLNFNALHLRNGIIRVVNSIPPPCPLRPLRLKIKAVAAAIYLLIKRRGRGGHREVKNVNYRASSVLKLCATKAN